MSRSFPRAPTVVAMLVCLAIQLGAWAAIPHRAFWGPDPGAKFLQLVDLAPDSRAIRDPIEELAPGRGLSALTSVFFVERGGERHGVYSPLFILPSRLLFDGIGFAGLYVLPLLSLPLTVLAMLVLVRRVAPGREAETWWFVGAGSPLLFYSMTFWEHAPATALAGVAVAAVVPAMERSGRTVWLLTAGVAAGAASVLRPELALVYVALPVAARWAWRAEFDARAFLAWTVGFALVQATALVYVRAEFGTFLSPHLLNNVTPFSTSDDPVAWLRERLSIVAHMTLPHPWRIGLCLLALTAPLATVLRRRSPAAATRYSSTFAVGVVVVGVAMLGANAARGWGLMTWIGACPWLVGLVAVHVLPADRPSPSPRLAVFLSTLTFVLGLLIVLASPNTGGLQWGSRYLLFVSVLAWPVLAGRLCRVPLRRPLLLVAPLLVLGVGIQLLGLITLDRQKRGQESMADALRGSPSRLILVDHALLVLLTAPEFHGAIVGLEPPLDRLRSLARDAGAGDRVTFARLRIGAPRFDPPRIRPELLEAPGVELVDRRSVAFRQQGRTGSREARLTLFDARLAPETPKPVP